MRVLRNKADRFRAAQIKLRGFKNLLISVGEEKEYGRILTKRLHNRVL